MTIFKPVHGVWRVRIAILLAVFATLLMPVIGAAAFLPPALHLRAALAAGDSTIIIEPTMFNGFLVMLVSACIFIVVMIFAVYPPMRTMPRVARAIFSFPLMLLALFVTFRAQDALASYMVNHGYSRCAVRDEPRLIKNGTVMATAWARPDACEQR